MLCKCNGLFRLTRDMEITQTSSGMAIGKLGLACSEKYKDKETVLFLDATSFGKQAEILNQYAGTKGTQIYLSGKLQTDSWTDKEGNKKSKTVMIVEGFEYRTKKHSHDHNNSRKKRCHPFIGRVYQRWTWMSQKFPFKMGY